MIRVLYLESVCSASGIMVEFAARFNKKASSQPTPVTLMITMGGAC